jgi:hypothetical protein
MEDKKNVWSGFFINLFGVILGILLTFGGNALWQQHEENKRIKEMLILLRNELETNKQWFKGQEKVMRKDVSVYKKILEAESDWTSIPVDTLQVYRTQTQYIEFTQLTFSAWEIFQSSEMIQKMTDKELVIRLTDCYFWINQIKEFIETHYWNEKIGSIAPEVELYKYFDALMTNKETVAFYTLSSSENLQNWSLFPVIDAIIDYTIMLLDKRGDFRYDMKEKDEEIELFIKNRVDSVLQKQ